MGKRSDLHILLKSILGSENVYFQPPHNTEMQYPCIVYRRDTINTLFADDHPYHNRTRYQLIVIDRDPDSLIISKVKELQMCVFDRHYTANNLNHDAFKLFF